MPNWTANVAHINHPDKSMLERLKKANENEAILQEFIPCPQELIDAEATPGVYEDNAKANLEKYGYPSWYEFRLNEWGTKWDISGELSDDFVLSFDSAWSPPLAAYDKLIEMGFTIKAYYYEPGMAFTGIYDNGSDTCYEDLKNIPEELDAMFDISADLEYAEDDENDDYDDEDCDDDEE